MTCLRSPSLDNCVTPEMGVIHFITRWDQSRGFKPIERLRNNNPKVQVHTFKLLYVSSYRFAPSRVSQPAQWTSTLFRLLSHIVFNTKTFCNCNCSMVALFSFNAALYSGELKGTLVNYYAKITLA